MQNQVNMVRVIGSVMLTCILICAEARDELTGKVIAVVDGNTIEVLTDENESVKLMLFGIDCPELEQAYGEEAKRFTEKILLDQEIKFQLNGKDRWGTRLAVITVNGVDARQTILRKGLAWTSEKNLIEELEQLKNEAKEKGMGLWGDDAPIAPWIFRRQQTMLVPKTS